MKITEFHGSMPLSESSLEMASRKWCPFVDLKCKKKGGACSLHTESIDPVIICPNRFYYDDFRIIRNIGSECFEPNADLITDVEAELRRRNDRLTGSEVIVYGQGFSGEMGIPGPPDSESESSFKIDFVLAQITEDMVPSKIVAIEVQAIDTTNTYQDASDCYYKGREYAGRSGDGRTKAGLNWENVSKRILPQLIYKGHALRREKLATEGMFVVLPYQVLSKIKTRVGGELLEYPRSLGTITFKSYGLLEEDAEGGRKVAQKDSFTTTVEQLAFAFVSPKNLPPLGAYESTIMSKLGEIARKRDSTLERDIQNLRRDI